MSEWWTAPAEADDASGRLVMVTGRDDVERFRSNPRFSIRVEVTWPYDTDDPSGMPSDELAARMEQAQEALQEVLRRDPVAVLTGIYTGAGRRDWIFYTPSTHIFGRKLNEALAPFPTLPLSVYCENDPAWEQYDEQQALRVE